MAETRQQRLESILLQLLPADHSAVGNIALWEQFQAAAQSDGVEVNGFDYFDTAKGELVSGGKGKIAA